MNARELAEKVGIVRAIDKLSDVDSSEEHKEILRNELIEALFPNFSTTKTEFSANLSKQLEQIATIRSEKNFRQKPSHDIQQKDIIDNIIKNKVSLFINMMDDNILGLQSEFLSKYSFFVHNIEEKINKSLREHKKNMDIKLSIARKNSLKNFWKFFSG